MSKYNVRRKAQLGLDIREGGIAIPIAPNMYYMNGRSHDNGGIAIGPNNKNGLEVEGGEVIKVGNNDIKVFSSVPLLRGVSPAQLVIEGVNPNKVFKAQEEFKDRNRINDDGTTYQNGGQKKSNSAIRTEADKKVPAYNRAVYSLVDPTMGYPTKKEAFGYAIGAGIKAMRNPNDMVYWVTDSVSDAAWRKRHGLSYDNKFLIPNEDGSVRLPKDREMEIPTDTTMLKNRIAANEKLSKRYPEGSEKRDIVDWALKVDGMALDSLRHTYRTGEPVTINEGAYNSRRLINNGELSYPEIMPHNVMQNYAIQYDKSKGKMNYWDTYNFNDFEWGVPGKPFEIRGSIPLKRFGGSKQDDTKTAALKNLKNKFTIRGNYKGGMFGGAGAGSVIMTQPEYVTDTITKKYLVPVTQNFNEPKGNSTPVDESYAARQSRGIQAVNEQSPSPTGGGTQSKEAPWIPQYNTITGRDWLGVGTNLAGHIASYFANNSLLKKYPMPNKPIMTPVVKFKTKHNIEPGLTNIDETTQVNRGVVRRNTQSSNTSLAREQRLANEARNAKNQLYGQKENIETQLINQDRRNRQDVYSRNVVAYNDWLNKTYVAKSNQLLSKQQNMMNLINGIPMAVNNIIGTIESRRATNNTIKAIAAANPNVDGRMFGIGDYYTQRLADGRTAIYNKNHKLVKYV